MKTDLLTGPTLKLRAVEPSDVDFLLAWENDTSIWRVSNTLAPYSRFEIEEYVLNARRDIFAARQLRLMVDRKEGTGSPETVGTIDLFDFDPVHLRAGVGIMISEPHRSQGYATEALQILIRYAKEGLMLHQLYCHISEDNPGSMALFKRFGFVRCGVKKEWLNTGEGWLDEYICQLIF